MKVRLLFPILLVSVLSFISLPSLVHAEQESTEVLSDEQRSAAIAHDALERLKRAKLEEKQSAEEPKETSIQESAVSSVSKKSIYFIALLMIGFSLFKKFSLKQTQQEEKEHIDVISRKALSSRSSLMIVQVENQKLLLAQNGDDVSFLTELSSIESLPAEVFSAIAEEHSPLPRKVMA